MWQTLDVSDRILQSTVCRCGLCSEVFGRRFEQLLSVIALVVLKCLFIITMCQWYLCTIKSFSFNYVWYFQSRLSTSILQPKKALPGVPFYLNGTCRLRISCPSLGKYIPDSGAFIWLHVCDDQPRGIMLYAHAQDMRRQRRRDVCKHDRGNGILSVCIWVTRRRRQFGLIL
jgi:hypothetical protein